MNGLMMERTRTAWRLVRDAGIEGADRDVIDAAMLKQDFTRPEINASLRNLKQMHYIRCEGRAPNHRWFVTGKIPVGESLNMHVVGMRGLDAPANGADDDSTDELFGKREAPKGVPKGVPSSIFAMGDMAARLAGETVADVIAEAAGQVTAAAAAVTAAVPGLNWTSAAAPAAAPAEAPAPAAAPEPAALADPRPSITQRIQANESPSQALQRLCVQAGLLPIGAGVPREPLFTLRSDNVLLIDACADGQFALNPNVTRALFRWLDRLGGTDLVRLTEQAS